MKRLSRKMKWPHLTFPHTQTIYFDNGERRVIRNIKYVEQGRWAHLLCDDLHDAGEIIINPDRVLCIRYSYEDNQKDN